ncbi:hypothetical protein FQR65_LT19342 [Abscondita terminalis]|nr:hypothetical protein FQR65_LT19342 [Abscondita terminalis]
MVKNALQAQLLKAGLVDNKKAKKLSKQAQHEQRTGQSNEAELKAKIEQDKQEKVSKDQALNQEKQRILDEKALKASIIQMIKQHKIKDTDGDVTYQFIDGSIKKIYLNQQVYNALVAGSLVIAHDHDAYAILPKALADRINEKMTGFIIVNNSEKNEQVTDEEGSLCSLPVLPNPAKLLHTILSLITTNKNQTIIVSAQSTSSCATKVAALGRNLIERVVSALFSIYYAKHAKFQRNVEIEAEMNLKSDQIELTQEEVHKLADTFKLLGDASRLKILLFCMRGPSSVGEILQPLDLHKS